jgi:16S rRNA (guanine527-N7)-methyltransferase
VTPAARAALLDVLGDARSRGYLGPGPVEEQLEHALAFGRHLPEAASLDALDLGSGGGVPALCLAAELPESRWTLVDGMTRRTTFLVEAVARLGLATRVEVVTARAETLPETWRARFGAVTARSFGPPPVLAECAAPWLRLDGVLVVSEPPGGAADRWPAGGLAELGLQLDEVTVGPPALACLRQVAPCPARYPRRVGVPAKRPLW